MKPDSKKKKYPVKPPAMSQEVNKDEAVIDRQLTRNEGMLMNLRGRPEQASSHQIDPEAGVNMQMTKHEELLMEMADPRPWVNRIGAQPRMNQIATTTTTTTTKRPETNEHIFKLPVKTQAILFICLSASASLILIGLIILECLLEKRWNKEECHPDPDPDPEPVPDPDPERPRRRSVTFSEYLPTRRSVMESVMESEGRYNEGNEIDTESEDSLDRYYVQEDGDHLMEQVETESESSEEEVEEVESSDKTESKENVSQNFKEVSATELQNRQQYKHSQKAKQQTLHVSMEQPNVGLPDKQRYSCPQEPNIGLQYKQLYNYKQEPNIRLYACSQESDRSSQDKVLYNNRQNANIRLKNAYAYKTLQRNYKEPYIAINGKIYRCWKEVDTEPRYEEINEIAPRSKGRTFLKKFKPCIMKPCVLD
ncbi:uncharacterized protein LOC121385598 [Gigantopelta aegis]|uniref:uncharacterized protein LOC121385598 n=1 Tax=Gigantopelta aegis TaxID=1735272 RepID=UPI001B889451|nr:uncharacterized protein LOC121385598 [Gigantopelta aegis]